MKKGCGLCRRYGRGCQFHPDEPTDEDTELTEDLALSDADLADAAKTGPLSVPQLRAIELLIMKSPDETMAETAAKVPCARVSLWRWLRQPDFEEEYKSRVRAEFGSHRAAVAAALVRGAVQQGPGQAAMQRTYWEKLGELSQHLEVTGANGGPIQVFDLSKLSDADLMILEGLARKAGMLGDGDELPNETIEGEVIE